VRILLRVSVGIAALVALLAVAVWTIVRPPAPLALPEPGAVLEGVTLVEPGVSRRASVRVVVEGSSIERIEYVSPDAAGPFAGTFVLPGLVDLHVHFPPPTLPGQTELFAFLHLYHGVTTVRDAGDPDGRSTEPARQGVAEGRFPGPHVLACGRIVDGDPPLWKSSLVARTPEEGRDAVRRIAEGDFDCVKAYDGLDASTLDAIREEAHARSLPVIGHVPRRVPFEVARLDDAQHLIGVPPPPEDPAVRFPRILAQWLELDDARLDGIIAASLRHRITHTPTLVTLDRLVAQADRAAALREADALLLPRFYRAVVWNPELGFPAARELGPQGFAMVRAAQQVQLRTVKRLFDAGVELHTGTDTLIPFVVPGAGMYRELRLFVRAGLTPEQALALSTRSSARFLDVDGLGELREGAPAELAVFRDDPTRDLAALDTLVAVVRDGRLYTREALDAQLARYRGHHEGTLYDALVTPLVRRVLAATLPKREVEKR
jgi:imidazolonepropionase-like amidohydrolase